MLLSLKQHQYNVQVVVFLLSLSMKLIPSFSFELMTTRTAFLHTAVNHHHHHPVSRKPLFLKSSQLFSSFAADGSEYSSDNNNDLEDDADIDGLKGSGGRRDSDEDETPTIELQPLPMSKNSGNRMVAFIWDQELNDLKLNNNKDELDLHYDRISLTEDHVMFCRKANLYNESFNTDSACDVLWSLPM